ncbi:hypothetical protein QYF36_004012 [Acer negundo]|nr:hypothetical protein QYF36_004012 [Acer negundo]
MYINLPSLSHFLINFTISFYSTSFKLLHPFIFLRNHEQASAAGTLNPVTWGVSVGGVVDHPHSGLVPGLMFGRVTGTVQPGTVGPTILLAAPAASTSVVVVVIVLVGNLEIGFAPGLDAMNTTLLAEWNVSDAMPQGTLVTGFHTKHITHHFRVLQATKS